MKNRHYGKKEKTLNRVCLCLNSATLADSLVQLQAEKYFDPALDLAELRLDYMLDFADGPSLQQSQSSKLEQSLQKLCAELAQLNLRQNALPVQFVLTLRKQKDGGNCPDEMSDSDYLAILCLCVEAFPQKYSLEFTGQHSNQPLAYLDLDAPLLQRVSQRALQSNLKDIQAQEIYVKLLAQLQERRTQLIASIHDFGPLPSPSGLQLLLDEMEQLELPPNTLFKLAVMAASSQELARFYRFVQNCKKQNSSDKAYILLAMGEFGSSSRILLPHTGSQWTFCCSGQVPVASGQFSLDELVESYNYRNIGLKTQIYGVIGDPIAHSRSPEIHNPIYRQRGWDAVYLRFRADNLQDFLALRDLLPIRGISCTVPHKQTLASMASAQASCSPAVRALKAGNTFYLQANGDWRAENTDIVGFLRPLQDLCAKHHFTLRGKTAAIIGAGGAARAAIYALLCCGVDCEIYNRTLTKAQMLAKDFAPIFATDFQGLLPDSPKTGSPGKIIKIASLEGGRHIGENCELLVQTTTVGMNSSSNPIPHYLFCSGQIAYDLVYQPPRTAFLQAAERAGAFTLNGSAMLQTQALAQIELFRELHG